MTHTDALRGSITPLVTPFDAGEIDMHRFELAVERQVSAGAQGVVVTGTTGEPTSLTPGERIKLYQRAVDVAAGRLLVIAATGSANHRETLSLTAAADGAGVDGVLVVCPPFVQPSESGLCGHFAAVAEQTDRPILIYNIPGRAACSISPESLESLATSIPNIVGVKHASRDLDFVTDVLLRLGAEFRVFCGQESLCYPMLSLGAAGVMSAVGNLLPESVTELCEAVFAGRHERALSLHRALFAVNRAVFAESNPAPLKHMLMLAGHGNGELRPPLAPLGETARTSVTDAFAACSALGLASRGTPA